MPMFASETLLLTVLAGSIFAVALLYASVGHGGASGYLAVMALFGLAPAALKPTALLLNILVAGIAVIAFARAGHFRWRLFWPFAATSIPASFLGGAMSLPPDFYRPLLGMILLFSALRLLLRRSREDAVATRPLPVTIALPAGAALGLLSGLTGVGGGIFLSPLLLFFGWAGIRETAAVSALFIVANSAAGLLGHLGSLQAVPAFAPLLAAAAVAGGLAGARLGSRRLPPVAILRLLAVVLTIAGIKLILL
jgi:uncharacterized membrane protein YfcA